MDALPKISIACPKCKITFITRLQNFDTEIKGYCPHCSTLLGVNIRIEVREKNRTSTSIGKANHWKRHFGTAKSHFGY